MTTKQDLRPAVFVDRDGTINVERHYLSDPDQLELIPGALEALKAFQDAGYVFVIVTNQSGIARGYFDLDRLDEIHDRLRDMLSEGDVTPDAVYICPHGPDDDCTCRKPLPGMAEQAAKDLGLDLTQSVMIGDKIADVGLGKAIGAKSILVRTGHGVDHEAKAGPLADYVADDLLGAAKWVLSNR